MPDKQTPIIFAVQTESLRRVQVMGCRLKPIIYMLLDIQEIVLVFREEYASANYQRRQ